MESSVLASTTRPLAQMAAFQFDIARFATLAQQFDIVSRVRTIDGDCVSAWRFRLNFHLTNRIVADRTTDLLTFVAAAAIFFARTGTVKI